MCFPNYVGCAIVVCLGSCFRPCISDFCALSLMRSGYLDFILREGSGIAYLRGFGEECSMGRRDPGSGCGVRWYVWWYEKWGDRRVPVVKV